jgi:dTDP-4-dehydrorhamnose 3,5-epimerase-like enzyme
MSLMATDKIVITRLPCGNEGNVPRRILESRGEMAILHPVGPVYNPVYFDLKPGHGNVRGRHYHNTKTEIFYLISGSCRLTWLDLDTGEKGALEAHQGDLVTIKPRCAHRFEAMEYCQVVEFSKEDVEYSRDTFPTPKV